MITSRKKILGAFLVGIVMVVGAWQISTLSAPVPQTGTLEVVSSDTLERTFIAVNDRDGDGIADWQEALQQTDPVEITAASSSYEEPDTLTGKFAIEFLQEMVRSENYDAFGSEPAELANFATDAFAEQATDELYTEEDIIISPNTGKEAIRTYANSLASAVLDTSIPGDYPNELDILRRAYATNNEDDLEKLDLIITNYNRLLERTLDIPVPASYKKEHLNLINVYQAVLTDIEAMRAAFSDPLFTMIRLKRYEEDAASLTIVILDLYRKVLTDEVSFNEGDPALIFIQS